MDINPSLGKLNLCCCIIISVSMASKAAHYVYVQTLAGYKKESSSGIWSGNSLNNHIYIIQHMYNVSVVLFYTRKVFWDVKPILSKGKDGEN